MSAKINKERLKGRETEFALNLLDEMLSDSFLEELEYDIILDEGKTLKQLSSERLYDIIKELHTVVSDCYKVAHGYNKYNSCYNSHDKWREFGLEKYESLVKSELHCDTFNLFEDEKAELNLKDYQRAKVVDAINVEREFGDISIDKENIIEYIFKEKEHQEGKELVLIRSSRDRNKYFIIKDYINGLNGKIVYIEEKEMAALSAKNALTD